MALKKLFEENFLTTGICVIVVCIVEVTSARRPSSPQSTGGASGLICGASRFFSAGSGHVLRHDALLSHPIWADLQAVAADAPSPPTRLIYEPITSSISPLLKATNANTLQSSWGGSECLFTFISFLIARHKKNKRQRLRGGRFSK